MKNIRETVTAAIVEEYKKHGSDKQLSLVIQALHRIPSDLNLIAFAIDLGIDTNALLLEEAVRS